MLSTSLLRNSALQILTSHLAALLTARLPKSCRVGSSDVKVNVLATGLSVYPDGSVFCGELKRDRIDANALTNPTLLFEVTSPSTEDVVRSSSSTRRFRHS